MTDQAVSDLTDVELDALEDAVRRSPDTMLAVIDALRAERCRADDLEAALNELVALKDGPRDDAYERAKPVAWQRARDLVAGDVPDDAAPPSDSGGRPVQTVRYEVEVGVPHEPLLDDEDQDRLARSLASGVARLGWGVDVNVARI